MTQTSHKFPAVALAFALGAACAQIRPSWP